LVYWILKRIFIGPIVKLLFRPWVKGLANVPGTGAAILASNHLSFSDSIFLPIVVPRPVVFLAKQEYFTGTGLKGWLTALFFRATNQLPMDRSGGDASTASLDAGAGVLHGGGLLGIYPEGIRSPDGKLYRGKVGVARLALLARVPVIPVAMIGTDKVQPIGQRLPSIRRVGIIVGQPLDLSEFYDRAEDRGVQREVTNRIMRHIQQLSAQEYVDLNAAAVKAQLAEEAAAQKRRDREAPDA
jgi:1-acyl-sn-glycerol-3-phosphate acyltransferase